MHFMEGYNERLQKVMTAQEAPMTPFPLQATLLRYYGHTLLTVMHASMKAGEPLALTPEVLKALYCYVARSCQAALRELRLPKKVVHKDEEDQDFEDRYPLYKWERRNVENALSRQIKVPGMSLICWCLLAALLTVLSASCAHKSVCNTAFKLC